MGVMNFSAYTDCKEFQNVPALIGKYSKIGQVIDYGTEDYILDINGVSLAEYEEYLNLLKEKEFKQHSSNADGELSEYVKMATFTKENLVLSITHLVKLDKTCISASFDLPLSEHLVCREKCKKSGKKTAATKLHMPQLNSAGNSFVIQLKNGHFVIHDGGKREDAPYLLDYLEELAPEGEKPVVEAWFISHAHDDHYGAMTRIAHDEELVNRICVEGFYFQVPGVYTTMWNGDAFVDAVLESIPHFRNRLGQETTLYRPQMGQRYYFCDMEIDVCLTPELFSEDGYYYNTDINDTSIWLMNCIEGQKFLVAGDTAHTACHAAMSIFPQTYFEMDVFAVFHHGINVYDYFTNYMSADTVLYPSFHLGSIYKDTTITSARIKENANLKEKAKESLSYENGTVVLTFPYEVGTAEIMEPFDWRHNEGGVQMIYDYDNP